MNDGKEKKGIWDIVDIFIKPLGGLLTAVVIALVGHQLNANIARQQTIDSRFRLYSELMSNREQAESDLRKDMFASIINSFMKPEEVSLESKVLNLELLTQNFHESLNMKPLFIHLKRKISQDSNASQQERLEYMRRLNRVAREITRKQMIALESHGQWFDRTVTWQSSSSELPEASMVNRTMILDGVEREFHLNVKEIIPETKELEINLVIVSEDDDGDPEAASFSFSLSFFDFPMIDNIRLSHDQRCAVVLNNFADTYADITVVYFPGCYASLKEKPYYQDVYRKLLSSDVSPVEGI